jgi:hypothetical protein
MGINMISMDEHTFILVLNQDMNNIKVLKAKKCAIMGIWTL